MHTDDRRHQRDVGERNVFTEQPRAFTPFDFSIHPLVAPAQSRHSCLHVFCGNPVRPIASMNSLRSGFDSANARNSSSLIAAKRGKKAKLNVGTRTAGAGISSMKRKSARIFARMTGSGGVKFASSGSISSRYSMMTDESRMIDPS